MSYHGSKWYQGRKCYITVVKWYQGRKCHITVVKWYQGRKCSITAVKWYQGRKCHITVVKWYQGRKCSITVVKWYQGRKCHITVVKTYKGMAWLELNFPPGFYYRDKWWNIFFPWYQIANLIWHFHLKARDIEKVTPRKLIDVKLKKTVNFRLWALGLLEGVFGGLINGGGGGLYPGGLITGPKEAFHEAT